MVHIECDIGFALATHVDEVVSSDALLGVVADGDVIRRRRIDAHIDGIVFLHTVQRVVGQLHLIDIGVAFDVVTQQFAADVLAALQHVLLRCRLGNAVQTGSAARRVAGVEDVVEVARHVVYGQQAVEVVGDGIVDGEQFVAIRSHIQVVEFEGLVVDGEARAGDGRRARVVKSEVHRQRVAAQQGLAGIGDVVLEVVDELLCVFHDVGGLLVVGIGEPVDSGDAQVVQESVVAGHHEVVARGTHGDVGRRSEVVVNIDSRGIEDSLRLRETDALGTAAHGVVAACP